MYIQVASGVKRRVQRIHTKIQAQFCLYGEGMGNWDGKVVLGSLIDGLPVVKSESIEVCICRKVDKISPIPKRLP